MPEPLNNHRAAIGKIYLVAGLSLALLTAGFYLFGYLPLQKRLQQEHAFRIEHFLESTHWLLQAVVDRHYELAQQSASRTAIRKKQAAWLRGEVSLDEMTAFSRPKLADAMLANDEIAGIARFDPQGNQLFHVGLQLPDALADRCMLSQLSGIRMLDPAVIDGRRYLLYCSPIDDRQAGRVGADVLIMTDNAIRGIVNASSHYDDNGMIGAVTDSGILYWPEPDPDPLSRRALEGFVENRSLPPGFEIRTDALAGNDWQVAIVVNENRFYEELHGQMLILLAVIAAVTITLFILTIMTLRPVIRSLMRQRMLEEMSQRDGLTGLYNHAFMQEMLDTGIARAKRHKLPLSILMLDIDRFKNINDSYGHPAGDEVLIRIAERINDCTRKEDTVARYGGEEFLVILPDTIEEGACIVARRIRMNVANMTFSPAGKEISLTISAGLVCCNFGAQEIDKRDLIQAADRALYQSKKNGRDRLTVKMLPPENSGSDSPASDA